MQNMNSNKLFLKIQVGYYLEKIIKKKNQRLFDNI